MDTPRTPQRHDYNAWSEHDWEEELKREDARIAAFVRELSSLLDMPGEADLIMKRLERRPELIPDLNMWRQEAWDTDDSSAIEEPGDEEDTLFEEWMDKPGAEMYLELGDLSTELSRMLASAHTGRVVPEGVPVLCEFGRACSYALDMLELGGNELPALKIALCKRMVASVQRIIEGLAALKAVLPAHVEALGVQIDRLQQFRGAAIEMQSRLRSTLPARGES